MSEFYIEKPQGVTTSTALFVRKNYHMECYGTLHSFSDPLPYLLGYASGLKGKTIVSLDAIFGLIKRDPVIQVVLNTMILPYRKAHLLSAVRVVMVTWATWLILARASPRKPYVPILVRSSNFSSLLVVKRSHTISMSSFCKNVDRTLLHLLHCGGHYYIYYTVYTEGPLLKDTL